jgi:hypothetical protein
VIDEAQRLPSLLPPCVALNRKMDGSLTGPRSDLVRAVSRAWRACLLELAISLLAG